MGGSPQLSGRGQSLAPILRVAGRRVWLELYEKREQSSGRVPGVGEREDKPFYLCETGSCGETGAEVGNDLTSVRSVCLGGTELEKGKEGRNDLQGC